MNNEELLEQIKELFVTEREHTKKMLEANNTVLGTIFKVELAETNKRINANKQDIKALKKGQEHIEHKLDEVIEEDTEERLDIIEEHLGLPHKY